MTPKEVWLSTGLEYVSVTTLAPAVLEQLARLGAALAPSVPPAELRGLDGAVALPLPLAVLHAVHWPAGNGPFPFKHSGIREDVGLGGSLDALQTRGHEGPLYAIAEDRLQHYFVIRADDDASDPLVYRIDHDGSDTLETGVPLSRFLAALKPVAPVSELLTAMRDRGTEAAIASIRSDPETARKAFDKKSGFQPIHLAILQQRPEVVAALLDVGAQPNAPLRASTKFARKYMGDWPWMMTKPTLEAGEAPLHLAVRESPKTVRLGSQDVEIVRQLLAAGANPNATDTAGHTPLQLLAGAGVSASADELMKVLLEAGAKPDLFGTETPSPLVLSLGKPERAKMLLEAGANPNAPTVYFTGTVAGGPDRRLPGTAIHAAAARDEDAMLKLMLDRYGGLTDVVASDGSTPLDNAYGSAGFLLRTKLAQR